MSGYTPEPDVRQRLVDAIRMLERAELIDYSGHCSARRDNRSFYINSGASVRSTLTTSDIVAVDLDGAVVEGNGKPPLELHIHAAVYRARSHANAVMHTHPRWSTALTMTGAKYEPVCPQGVLLGDVPIMDSPLSVNTKEMAAKLSSTLADAQAVLLKSHGAVILGTGIVEAFALALYLEENARRQHLALQIGEPYVFSEAEQQACRKNLWSANLFQKAWDYHRSKL